jgi:hypothetical protein
MPDRCGQVVLKEFQLDRSDDRGSRARFRANATATWPTSTGMVSEYGAFVRR